jgi:hypothetical protein
MRIFKMYRNSEILNNIEKISDAILEEKRSNHHRDHFFPAMINSLDYKHCCEIGVDKGGFSKHILEKTNIKKLFCVDPWIDDFGSDHDPEYFDPDGNVRMNQTKENLKEFIENGKAHLIKATGIEACTQFEDESLDFVYIDGDHSLMGVINDLYCWTPKVVTGGIISGHDFKDGPRSGMKDYFGGQLDYKVKTAVEDFTKRYGFKLNVVGGRILSWWFVKI